LFIYQWRSPLCHLELRAHFLETRSERFDLLLLARDCPFHSLDFAMFFEEFI